MSEESSSQGSWYQTSEEGLPVFEFITINNIKTAIKKTLKKKKNPQIPQDKSIIPTLLSFVNANPNNIVCEDCGKIHYDYYSHYITSDNEHFLRTDIPQLCSKCSDKRHQEECRTM